VKSTVKISTTNLGYKNTYSWKIVSASKYSDRQPEVSTWPPKTEIITFMELLQIASKLQHRIPGFRWSPARQKISQMTATTIDYQKLHDWRTKNVYIAISCCRTSVIIAITWRHFIRARLWSKIPDLPLEFRRYLFYFRWYNYFPFLVAMSLFPVVVRCYI